MWYGLYSKAKTYSTGNKEDDTTIKTESVVSGMIWGSQWDAMLNWMQGNGVNVKSTHPNGAYYNNTWVTGSINLDKVKNVYDLLGCNREDTMCSYGCMYRSSMSGTGKEAIMPTARSGTLSTSCDTEEGTRLTLYVK